MRLALRIDNSRRGRIHGAWNILRTTKARTSCNISNERADFLHVLVYSSTIELKFDLKGKQI